jgi:hypothetical protein
MPKAEHPTPHLPKADDTLLQRVLSFIKTHGEKDACRLLDTPRHTLARVAAGLAVRRTTLVCLCAQLDKHAPVASPDASKGANNAAA